MRFARCAAGANRSWMAPVKDFDGYIFDYGGVLVLHQSEADQARMAQAAGIPTEQFMELYWASRLDYDKGLLSSLEYWAELGRSGGKMLSPSVIDELMELDSTTWMNFDEPMWRWIDELRGAGKRVAMLSNMPGELGETIKARTDRMKRFDHVTLSYEINSAKPEAPIYEHCLEGIGTDPARTVFFDDRLANVRGAEMLGMQAVEFLNRDDVLARFRG
jgi:putative hydrolase of the HAD superfamily